VFVHFLGSKESPGPHICLQKRPLAGTCAFFIPQRDIDLPLKHSVLGSKGKKEQKPFLTVFGPSMGGMLFL
jgi:hypothetical protein